MVGDLRDHRHLASRCATGWSALTRSMSGVDQLDQAVDGGIGRAEWENDGQEFCSGIAAKGRARIETLW